MAPASPSSPPEPRRGSPSARAPGDRLIAGDLVLTPLAVSDAAAMISVLGGADLYRYTGGHPPTLVELTSQYRRQAAGCSPDGREEWRNWIIRLRATGQAVGYVQATITDGGRQAEIAWVVGTPWQDQGHATAAARALVPWLEARGVTAVRARIHPSHAASARVAARAGLAPTGLLEDGEQVWVRRCPAGGG